MLMGYRNTPLSPEPEVLIQWLEADGLVLYLEWVAVENLSETNI